MPERGRLVLVDGDGQLLIKSSNNISKYSVDEEVELKGGGIVRVLGSFHEGTVECRVTAFVDSVRNKYGDNYFFHSNKLQSDNIKLINDQFIRCLTERPVVKHEIKSAYLAEFEKHFLDPEKSIYREIDSTMIALGYDIADRNIEITKLIRYLLQLDFCRGFCLLMKPQAKNKCSKALWSECMNGAIASVLQQYYRGYLVLENGQVMASRDVRKYTVGSVKPYINGEGLEQTSTIAHVFFDPNAQRSATAAASVMHDALSLSRARAGAFLREELMTTRMAGPAQVLENPELDHPEPKKQVFKLGKDEPEDEPEEELLEEREEEAFNNFRVNINRDRGWLNELEAEGRRESSREGNRGGAAPSEQELPRIEFKFN